MTKDKQLINDGWDSLRFWINEGSHWYGQFGFDTRKCIVSNLEAILKQCRRHSPGAKSPSSDKQIISAKLSDALDLVGYISDYDSKRAVLEVFFQLILTLQHTVLALFYRREIQRAHQQILDLRYAVFHDSVKQGSNQDVSLIMSMEHALYEESKQLSKHIDNFRLDDYRKASRVMIRKSLVMRDCMIAQGSATSALPSTFLLEENARGYFQSKTFPNVSLSTMLNQSNIFSLLQLYFIIQVAAQKICEPISKLDLVLQKAATLDKVTDYLGHPPLFVPEKLDEYPIRYGVRSLLQTLKAQSKVFLAKSATISNTKNRETFGKLHRIRFHYSHSKRSDVGDRHLSKQDNQPPSFR